MSISVFFCLLPLIAQLKLLFIFILTLVCFSADMHLDGELFLGRKLFDECMSITRRTGTFMFDYVLLFLYRTNGLLCMISWYQFKLWDCNHSFQSIHHLFFYMQMRAMAGIRSVLWSSMRQLLKVCSRLFSRFCYFHVKQFWWAKFHNNTSWQVFDCCVFSEDQFGHYINSPQVNVQNLCTLLVDVYTLTHAIHQNIHAPHHNKHTNIHIPPISVQCLCTLPVGALWRRVKGWSWVWRWPTPSEWEYHLK